MISYSETEGKKTIEIHYIFQAPAMGGLGVSAVHTSDINELRCVLLKRPPGK